MKAFRLVFLLIILSLSGWAQVVIAPHCFTATDEITILYDATKGQSCLVGESKVYVHAGVIIDSPTSTSWQHVVGNWGQDDGVGLMTKVPGETDKWQLTITPNSYFGVPVNETVYRLAFVFRNADGSKAGRSYEGGDMFITLASNNVNLILESPVPSAMYAGDMLHIEAATCDNIDYTLKIDGITETTASSTNTFIYDYLVGQPAGSTVSVVLEATDGIATDTKSFQFTVSEISASVARPAGIVDGINYGADPTKVTLSLWAPFKQSVHVAGDFNSWSVDPAYRMNKDGEHFWIELTGLTPGVEYGYQYLVDNSLWIADPYADKILDPDDQYIPSSTYPNLKPYPAQAKHEAWYENRVAIIQTNQTPYAWVNTDFQRPPKEDLVIYELLVRDFLGPDNMNYQALLDTLDYLDNLGVNAIELMPIMEFNGNESWGYNPTFMFAVDKAYGTKDDLKAFIDECHGRGIAVILDMVMNQNDAPSPYASMYFNYSCFQATDENPWFNKVARHPYNVFVDINHESTYTQTWLDSINHYWINEFHLDGYRFDLSKGFTQNYTTDVGIWSQRDNSRIAILKRMADKIWSHTPDAYVILEHFANNDEELILSDYGMLLWGNHMYDYNEANMGYANGKSIGGAYFENRGWNQNGLVAYMESHDEERQMYKILQYGASSGAYNIQNLSTALQRLKLTASFFFTVPGPKMLWQWGEFGYDISIDENGRTGRKPTKWEYLNDSKRKNVYEVYSELINLRERYDFINKGQFSWQPYGDYKSIHITKEDTSVVIVGNFAVDAQEVDPNFQHTGTWYDFFSSKQFSVAGVNNLINLNPGEFHIYTDKKLHAPNYDIITALAEDNYTALSIYPNPVERNLNVTFSDFKGGKELVWSVTDLTGKIMLSGEVMVHQSMSMDVSSLPRGIYILKVADRNSESTTRFIKQ